MLCFSPAQSMASNFFHFLLLLAVFFTISDATGLIGVNYGRVANDLPTPDKVVELLKSQGINRIKLYDTNSDVLTALADSNISVVVAMPNEILASTAADQSFADDWVKSNISKYYPATKIEAIAVGNEVFVDPNNTTMYLVSAMKNVYNSLVKYNLNSSIKVSSPIALSALQNSYPSSAGSFKSDLIEPVVKPMLDFLSQSGSYLMVNIYPFFAYSANSDQISINYALFENNSGNVDSGNGLKYTNLLDAQLDAVYAAMAAVNHNDVKVVVTETGWPSQGDSNEVGAGAGNAASYNGNLVKRVLTGNGTPLKPNDPLNVYLFALFNENQKSGPTSERNYGLFYPNEQKVYSVPFNQEQLENWESSSSSAGSGNQSGEAAPSGVSRTSVGSTWCVASENADEKKLQEALNYACGEGKADCSPIQPGASCYSPDTLAAHASYAFNSYYQKNSRATGTCDFGGAAYVVTQAPSYGSCEFPTGNGN